MYFRIAFNELMGRMREPRRFLQVVTGPRQVGKSTMVMEVLRTLGLPYIYCTADGVPATNAQWISDRWSSARVQMAVGGYGEMVLAIDEVQKLGNWSEVVKREWDADTFHGLGLKVILLGSSRVMLSRGLSESLFGRFEELRLPHWSYAEMRDAFGFSLEQFVYFGGYPGAASMVRQETRWSGYIHSAVIDATINKDILVDAPVGKPALLRQTLELSAAYSGRILSLTKMLGALQDAGNTVTLSGYLNLLGDSGLVAGLQKFSVDLVRRKASIPKYQVYNNALLGVSCGQSFKGAVQDGRLWGHLFESAVGTHILNQAFVHRFEVLYWREGDLEVDFVLRKHGRLVGIEVKSAGDAATRGLSVFRERYEPVHAFVVGRDGIDPATFLSMDLAGLF